MTYQPQTFDNLLGLTGFSNQLLQNHFKLYQGYVANTNKLLDILSSMTKEGKTAAPEFAEVQRRFGWEFNGMRLHELYFSNLTKNSQPLSAGSSLLKVLVEQFGSVELWEKQFRALGAMRGIGWGALQYDPTSKKLINIWINEHDVGHLATTKSLLIMDVFEHAFMLDYGLNRADYVHAFFKSIDWNEIEKRFSSP